jgi:hypothetical protein
VKILYDTPAEEGRRLYGPEFRSMDEVWAAHALLGGDGAEHSLIRGNIDGSRAEALLDASKRHRVPAEDKTVQGHHFEVAADSNDWKEVGERFVAAARAHEQRTLAAPTGEHPPPQKLTAPSEEPASSGTGGAAASAVAAANSDSPASPADDAHFGLHQLASKASASAESGAVSATGHGLVHDSLSTNFVAFAALFERAVQAVDPTVAVPYHAAGAPGDPAAERRRGAITRHVRHATWSENFVADDATASLLRLQPADPPSTDATATSAQDGGVAQPTSSPSSERASVAVGAHGDATPSADTPAAAADAAGGAAAVVLPPSEGGGVPVTVEGRWAYFPVFTTIEPMAGERGRRGHHDYKGYSVPLVVADVAPGAPNPFEKVHTLPPIAPDHDHEFKDGQLFHSHGKGGAHRHV